VLNRLVCKCVEKSIMVNEIVGFGSLILFFLINILSELPIKCVVEFGRFVKILEE
jgi:hypothetical protein